MLYINIYKFIYAINDSDKKKNIQKEYTKLSMNKNCSMLFSHKLVESNCTNGNIAVYNITIVDQIQD